ncbi:MAG: DUF177 domain-containing protein [Flavobacterium sp.]|nr:DUF177 domain-containing protein [Flavobacterium sp.]
MKLANEFLIPFVGLKLGKHHFEFQINNTFFDRFDYHEYESSDIKVNIVLDKKSTMLELNFKQDGTVNVPCDLTNELFDLPVKAKIKLMVQFGEEFNNDNEELLILPHGEFQIDVAQYIYEMIVLSVPLKRVHVGIKNKTLDQEVMKTLDILKANNTKTQSSKQEISDPRWDKLKQLLTDK